MLGRKRAFIDFLPLQLLKQGLQREIWPLIKPVAYLPLRQRRQLFTLMKKSGWDTAKSSTQKKSFLSKEELMKMHGYMQIEKYPYRNALSHLFFWRFPVTLAQQDKGYS